VLETDAFDETPLDATPGPNPDAEDRDAIADFTVTPGDFWEETGAEDLLELDNSDADDADTDDGDADDADAQPVPGGSGYVWNRPPEDLTTWWWSLPDQTRSQLAALRPGSVLNPVLARAVTAAGLPCPRVPITVNGRRAMQLVTTAALVHTLNQARMAHSERRLV
jgi:hypothetical protein